MSSQSAYHKGCLCRRCQQWRQRRPCAAAPTPRAAIEQEALRLGVEVPLGDDERARSYAPDWLSWIEERVA